MSTSRKTSYYDVNVKANLAMAELGNGREAMATFSYIIGMPPPSSQSNWDTHSKNLGKSLTPVIEAQFNSAAKSLRHCLQKDNPEVVEDNIIDVGVSFDGTWHHKGFKSSHGIGIIISIDTGEILDAEVISKTCEACQRAPYSKGTLEYKQWLEKHTRERKCFKNFDGPSTGMETAAAKAIWSRSEVKHKMRYTTVLSDGDNKTLQALNDMTVYDTEITKLECVNHIHKRMGTGLRNLVKKCQHIKGGRGGLTAQFIEKLSSYYRKSIMDFVTTSKDLEEQKSAVENMKINIIAGLHHSVCNDDPKEQHKFCLHNSVQWCKYKNQMGSSSTSPKHTKENRLPA